MRIGIDAYPLAKNQTGLGTYLTNLIKEIESIDKEHEYFLYTPKMFELPFQNKRWHIRLVRPCFPGRAGIISLICLVNFMARYDRIDVFWETQNFLPPLLPHKVKRVLSLHDLVSYVCPQTLPKMLYPAHKLLLRTSVKSADKIFADSGATRDDVIKYFPGIDARKMDVVYCGDPEWIFTPGNKEESQQHLKNKFGISGKYILTVTSLEWRKNIPGLLEAFSICKNKLGLEHKLVIVIGSKRASVKEIYRHYNRLSLENEVYFLDYVDIKDLAHLYRGAGLFVFPSFYEGFGLPPLEAMACGTPVVASDIPVFKEILGDAALFPDPYDPEDIARKIYQLSQNIDLYNSLIQRGFKRVQLFSWRDSAKKILSALG